MKPVQIILILFVIFSLGKVFHKYKERGIHTLEFFLWILAWTGAGLIIAFPDISSVLAHSLGVGRGADLIVYSSLLIIFYLIFRIHLALDRLRQEVTEIVRAIALEQMRGQNSLPAGDRGPTNPRQASLQ